MGFKKIDRTFTFADAILKDSMDKNRCLIRIMDIAQSTDWDTIESVLMGHYQVGTSKEGADAYQPLLLFKCLLLQKWFHIDSDPELETRLTIKYHSKNSWDSPLTTLRLTIPPFHALEND